MNQLTIHTASDASEAAQQAGVLLTQTLSSCKTPLLLLLSGGSAWSVLDSVDTKVLDKRVMLGVLDERVSRDPKENNFSQLTRTAFFQKAVLTGLALYDTIPEIGETPQQLATRWEIVLRNWRQRHSDGKIVITQGIGPDGHTAGILPYISTSTGGEVEGPRRPAAMLFRTTLKEKRRALRGPAGGTTEPGPADFCKHFDDPSHWVVGYDAGPGAQHRLRVTVTFPFLRMVDVSVVYACGSEKQSALRQALAPVDDMAMTPARIIQDMQSVSLFTDCVNLQ